jgi:hypothetical protein
LFLMFLISCSNPTDPKSNITISKIDMKLFQQKNLPDYELIRKRARYEGREYLYRNLNDQTKNLYIRVGIHISKEYLREFVDEYNSWLMLMPQEDTTLGIGDQLWWMPDPLSPDTVSFQFIRNNVFVIINSHTLEYYELLSLTKSFDDAILNKENYIVFSNKSNPPIIKSISATKLQLKEGEETEITVNAYDPHSEDLEYISNLLYNISSNKFILIASKDYGLEPFIGKHVFEFYVINESNFVSKKKEIEIEIIN